MTDQPGMTWREKCAAFFDGMARTFGITAAPFKPRRQPVRGDDRG